MPSTHQLQMAESHLNISVPVDCLTLGGLMELQHGLHIQIKHIMHDFERCNIDATATKARLQGIADTNKSLLETYINHHEEQRKKEPF
jgi:hypothetical protein